jgi:Ca2+-binding EF-hand superfamily protein
MTSRSRKTFVAMLLASAAAIPTLALAQQGAAGPAGGDKTVRTMFAWADKNKDGQLTRAEAKGHLPITYKNFADIDTDKRGSISFEQFVAFTNKRVGKNADDILKIGQRL